MKRLKKIVNTRAVQIATTIVIIIVGLLLFSPFSYNFLADKTPPELINLKNNSSIYTVTIVPDSGYYQINQLDGERGKALIASAPESLEDYVNKQVKITGKMVWTYNWLKASGYKPDPTPVNPQSRGGAVGVKIDSIQLAE